ncbi:MAG: calcium-binding protein [Patulibacter sp.]|nr:calcium-binding protein [Patulibacter sp.]
MSFAGSQLRVSASAGEVLDVSARPLDTTTFEVDLGSATGWTAPAPCSQDGSAVLCPTASLASVNVTGGDGDDHVTLRGTVVLVADGGAGDDVLRGGDGNDHLVGGAGSDELAGRNGNDDLRGGDGADTLIGSAGDDDLQGGAGADFLDGADGNDTLAGGDGSDVLSGGVGNDILRGDAGDDQLDGGDGNDDLDGGDGADVGLGGTGDDRVAGGTGADQLDGGSGADTVDGGAGADVLLGSAGNDRLDGGDDDDELDGGDGDDELHGGSGADTLNGNDGADFLDGQAGTDTLTGGDGSDLVLGGDGDDTLIGALDGDTYAGGAGLDTLTYAAAATPLVVDLPGGTVTGTGPVMDRVIDAPEVVVGGTQGDTLRGSQTTGTVLIGGPGDDTLVGGPYADGFDGGDGRDTVDYSSRVTGVAIHANDVAESGAPGEGDTVASSIEVLIGGQGPDDLEGAPGPSELFGGPGDDRLEDLQDGDTDRLHCGTGTDLAIADRTDLVDGDCERWSNGAGLVRTIDPISAAVRSPRLLIDDGGRMHVSLVCGSEAVGTCRGKLSVQLWHGHKWRPGPTRSVLLTPGRRRDLTVFAQRGFRALVAKAGRHPKAKIHLEVRDAIGRTSATDAIVPLSLPAATGAKR